MRPLWLVALIGSVLVLASLAAPARGHAGDVEHLDVQHVTLPPGGVWGVDISFQSSHLQAGWLLVVNGEVTSGTGPIDVELVLHGVVVRTWSWTAGPWYANTAILPETADYNLTFRNPSPDVAEVEFFFDQSCECLGKLIPAPRGVVIFQVDLSVGERMDVTFETRGGLADARVDLARLRPGGEVWPDDFDILRTIHTGADETVLDFTAGSTERFYMIATAVQGAGLVVPHLDVTRAAPESLPAGVWILVLILAAVGAQLAFAAVRLHRRG